MPTFYEMLTQISNEVTQSVEGKNAGKIRPQSSSAAADSSQIRQLQDQVDRLSLGAEAMWRLLSEHLGFTDQHLFDIIAALDMSDGTKDGRFMPAPSNCSCGAAINAAAEQCQFCGAEAERRKVF